MRLTKVVAAVCLVGSLPLLFGNLSIVRDATAAGAALQELMFWQSPDSNAQEAYIEEPMPPGFQVVVNQLEGPMFADENGRTLYTWPLGALRNGSTGDRKDGTSDCTDEVLRHSSGLMSPYPAGLLLPDHAERKSCAEVWPPAIAPDDAEPIGKWTLTKRDSGAKQWAYDGYPLYTSNLDQRSGDALGGRTIRSGGDGGVVRIPAGPQPDIPPGFKVIPSSTGRLLVNGEEYSVYMSDADEPGRSNCDEQCLKDWTPILAPEIAVTRGEWTVVRQASGLGQWAFRGKPLYTRNDDPRSRSFLGSDLPGWHNVYTQRALPPPAEFTVQDAAFGGQVLADARGRTIYTYNCRDDSLAQLACDHPDSTQAYRLAICGNGDPEVCRETFPYVLAPPDARSVSRLWRVMAIDPDTGHRATAEQSGALHVWAYRDRPVYTYSGDRTSGVTRGDGFGEFTGSRNGYKAFVLRDNFQDNDFRG